MNLGISCKLDRLKYLKELIAMYEIGIEITDFVDPDIINNQELLLECKSKYLEYFKSNTVERTFHGPFFDLNIHATDDDFSTLSKQKIRKAVSICRDLDCKKIVFHTGYIPIAMSETYRDKVIEKQMKFWNELCNENSDLLICLENMFESDSNFIYQILDNCKKNNLKFCFDIAHSVVFSNEEPVIWIKKMERYLNHVHLSDCNGIYDEHKALGSGSLDITKYINKLQNVDSDLTFVIEVSDEERARNSLIYLEKKGLVQKKF